MEIYIKMEYGESIFFEKKYGVVTPEKKKYFITQEKEKI